MRNIFGKTQTVLQAHALYGAHGSAVHDTPVLEDLLSTQVRARLADLDIGPTSPTNINFLTRWHGVYMADVVNRPCVALVERRTKTAVTQFEWRFLDNNLDFAGRGFDVLLLWTTLDMFSALVGR